MIFLTATFPQISTVIVADSALEAVAYFMLVVGILLIAAYIMTMVWLHVRHVKKLKVEEKETIGQEGVVYS